MQENNSKLNRGQWLAFVNLIKSARIPWIFVALACLLSVVSSKVSVLFPDYSINFFEGGDITSRTVMTGIGLLLLAAVVSVTMNYVDARLRTGISMRLRNVVLKKILALRVPDIDSINPRELISRTSNDTGMLGDFIVTVFMVIIGEAFYFYFAMGTIYSYSTSLFIFQLVFIPLSLISHAIQGRFSFKYQYRIQHRLSRLTEYLSELLVNIPIIKVFTQEQREIANGEDRIDEYARVRTKSALFESIFVVINEFVRFSNRAFAILYGGYLVHSGAIGIGTWIAYFMISEQVALNIDLIMSQWAVLKGVQGSVERISEIMEMSEENYAGEAIEDPGADLSLRDVGFSYGDTQVLDHINAEIRRGKKIAIVGNSGSGKSTLLNLLMRFYRADRGGLYQGDQDANDIDLNAYRRQFAYVFQDVNLFSDTLRYNLSYGAGREVTDEEILEKCEMAGLSDFIAKQAEGLDSMISEGGSNISGGEMQRIGIVRALLRAPEIILLDEACANLDAITENRVLGNIPTETMIMVSHRMSSIIDSDHIIYMDGGSILAEGTHDELMTSCDAYRRLVETESMAV